MVFSGLESLRTGPNLQSSDSVGRLSDLLGVSSSAKSQGYLSSLNDLASCFGFTTDVHRESS